MPVRATSEEARGGQQRRSSRIAETLALMLVGLLTLIGAGTVGVAIKGTSDYSPPPQPPANAAPTAVGRAPSGTLAGQGLAASTPTTVTIGRIGVRASILALGANDDGTVQVPPLDRAMEAGWYKLGVSAGEIGNAVILGHVDSAKTGPAVFYRLGELRPGDRVTVGRADRTQAIFRVDGVRSYPKEAFPTELVYGPSKTASLRVITCGGTFDRKKRSYSDNVIVLATLVDFQPV